MLDFSPEIYFMNNVYVFFVQDYVHAFIVSFMKPTGKPKSFLNPEFTKGSFYHLQ